MKYMYASEFLQKLKNLKEQDLIEVKGLGEKLARNIVEFANSERHTKLINAFQQLENQDKGITIDPVTQFVSTLPQLLNSETIVITGSFDIPRPQIKAELEARGAKVTGSITAKTTILLAGEEAGSKLAKAEKLGTKIVTDYKELLN
jgi:DNA ligase (NAD+)